jgi:TetR/AcrR family transcriptional repressor of mexJK operon
MKSRSSASHTGKAGGRPTSEESEARLQRLLDVAKRNFLLAGYPETCLDTIARESRMAKKTIYSRFGGKAGLFGAILEPLRQAWIAKLQDIVIESKSPESVLEAAALQLLDVSTRPEAVELQRLLLTESRRFPDLVEGQYDSRGTLKAMSPLADYLQGAIRDKKLRLDDAQLAAEQFAYLVVGGIRERIMHGVAKRPDLRARKRLAKQAVRIFLMGCQTE